MASYGVRIPYPQPSISVMKDLFGGLFVCYSLYMDYKIEPGIKETDLAEWLENAAKKWGIFDDKRFK